MQVKLWGVRGSLPAPLQPEEGREHALRLLEEYEKARTQKAITPQDFVRSMTTPQTSGFGGHTSCVEIKTIKQRIIIDGGSGIRGLGEDIMRETSALGRAKIHILMTHFHWDHLIGLPFFIPVFIPGNEIHFYAVQEDLEANIRRIFSKPNFPVEYEKLGAKIFFHRLEPRRPFQLGEFTATPYQLDHPDPCWGYRIEHGGKAFSHCVDSECTRTTREQLGPDLPLYQNVDLLTFDAQYTFLEAAERVDWGHASGPVGIDLAMREKVKRVVFVHHDPAASFKKISHAEAQTREYYEAARKVITSQGDKPHDLDWCFGYEGLTVEL